MDLFPELQRFGPPSWAFAGTALMAAFIFALVWRHRSVSFARDLLWLEAAAFLWSVSAMLETACFTVEQKIFWSQAAYPGIAASPVFFLLFAMDYGQITRSRPNKSRLMLLFLIPALMVLAAFTNGWHHQLWTRLDLLPETGLAVYHHGPIFWVLVIYSYAVLFAGVLLLMRTLFRFSRHFQKRTLLLILGAALPWTGSILYVLGPNPVPGLDWAPLGFALAGLLLIWATLGMDLGMFNLVPIARNRLLEAMAEGMLAVDNKGRIVDANPALAKFLDLSPDRIMGHDASQVLAPWSGLDACFRRPACSIALKLREEPPLYAEISVSPIVGSIQGTLGKLLLFRDVTQRTQAMHSLQRMASTDELTNLANRRRFMELARREESRAQRYSRPLAVCMIDLDHFKRINDTHGHDMGDKVLEAMGSVLRSGSRDSDLPARLGGEEFAVLLPETGPVAALAVAERLRAAMADHPVPLENGSVRFTASIGVACQDPCRDFASLLKDADRALYAAKNNGRNRVEMAAGPSGSPAESGPDGSRP